MLWAQIRDWQPTDSTGRRGHGPYTVVCDSVCLAMWRDVWGLEARQVGTRQHTPTRASTCLYCGGCGRKILDPVDGQPCRAHGYDGCPPACFETSAAAVAFVQHYQRLSGREHIDQHVWETAETAWEGGRGVCDGELALYVWGLLR